MPGQRVGIAILAFAAIASCATPTEAKCSWRAFWCDEPPPNESPSPRERSRPDLVIEDIVLKAPARTKPQDPDSIVVNTVVANKGDDARNGFIVTCWFPCKEENWSPMYFSGMRAINGLAAGRSVVLGDDAWLSLSDCPFAAQRKFTCKVDSDNTVDESDETNNERSEVLLTGR